MSFYHYFLLVPVKDVKKHWYCFQYWTQVFGNVFTITGKFSKFSIVFYEWLLVVACVQLVVTCGYSYSTWGHSFSTRGHSLSLLLCSWSPVLYSWLLVFYLWSLVFYFVATRALLVVTGGHSCYIRSWSFVVNRNLSWSLEVMFVENFSIYQTKLIVFEKSQDFRLCFASMLQPHKQIFTKFWILYLRSRMESNSIKLYPLSRKNLST